MSFGQQKGHFSSALFLRVNCVGWLVLFAPSDTKQFIQDEQASPQGDGAVGQVEGWEVPGAVIEI